MKRLAFAFMVAAVAAAGACRSGERAEEEQTSGSMQASDSMHMMDESGMMSDTAHMMAGDTAQRM